METIIVQIKEKILNQIGEEFWEKLVQESKNLGWVEILVVPELF